MNTKSLSETNYPKADVLAKRQFLAENILDDHTTLSENFLVSTLPAESDVVSRWFLIKALGLLRSPAGLPLLLQICSAPDVQIDHTSLHAVCAWSLGRLGHQAAKEMLKLLSNEDPEVRRCAADALGEMRAGDAIPALSFALRNDERQVQLWAALSLAKMGVDSLDPLKLIVAEEQGPTREIALDAIKKIEEKVFH